MCKIKFEGPNTDLLVNNCIYILKILYLTNLCFKHTISRAVAGFFCQVVRPPAILNTISPVDSVGLHISYQLSLEILLSDPGLFIIRGLLVVSVQTIMAHTEATIAQSTA